jgi:hypothetical protein
VTTADVDFLSKRRPLLRSVQLCSTRTIPIRRRGDVRNSICRRARPALRTARFINSHKKAVAAYLPASAPPAVGTTSGRRRRRVEAADGVLGIGCASLRPCGLRYKEGVVFSRAAHYFFCIHLYSSLPPPNSSSAARPAAARAASACCDVVGSPIPPTPVCFTHTEPTPQKKAGSSWTAIAVGACCVSARAALRGSAPVAMAAANGARPAAPLRLCCAWLDRGHTTGLHLAAWVALFAHAPVLLAWLRQRHQARRIGSLFVQAPSSGRHAPRRGSGRWANPRGTSAAMAAANSVSRAPSARFWFVAVFVSGVLSRRPPLCGPSGYCLRQTPSVPPIGYRPAQITPGCSLCYNAVNMKDAITIAGLFINVLGCFMLFADSARVSRSISVAGPRLGHEADDKRARFKDALIAWWGCASIVVIGIGFALQICAFYFSE